MNHITPIPYNEFSRLISEATHWETKKDFNEHRDVTTYYNITTPIAKRIAPHSSMHMPTFYKITQPPEKH